MRDAFPASAPVEARRPKSARPSAEHPPHNIDCFARHVRARGGDHEDVVDRSGGAAYAGVSRDTIYTACERRELRHARIGGRRAIRIKPEWIDAWLERHARGSIAPHVPARVPQAT